MSAPSLHYRPPPDIAFDGDLPESRRFDDSYYSRHGGLAESRAVFLDGIGAPDIWCDRASFVIGELGLGTGLNFLATWAAWRDRPGQAPLHYVAVDGFPIRRNDMARALSAFPEMGELARRLVDALPPPLIGAHRLAFDDGQVQLTLLFDEALAALEGCEMQADAWYLDGFAPARNPDMWQSGLLRKVARLSRPGARIATYSAAGDVRRALEAAGFAVERRPGFAGKRHRLAGWLASTPPACRSKRPWYDLPPPRPGPVAVIGGGIAGLMAASACHRAGLETTLIAPQPVDPLPAALLAPRPDLGANAPARLSLLASLHAWRCYDDMPEPVRTGPRGLLQPLMGNVDRARADRAVAALDLPDDLLRLADPAELSALAGLRLDMPGLFWPHAGCVDPEAIARSATALIPRLTATVGRLDRLSDCWALSDASGGHLVDARSVILATGCIMSRLLGSLTPPMRSQPGRIALLKPESIPSRCLSYGGFLTPVLPFPGGAARILGSCYGVSDDPADDVQAMQAAARRAMGPSTDALQLQSATRIWRGSRAETIDHRPHAGPVIDPDMWRAAYSDACRGRQAAPPSAPPVIEGLYVLTGLGGRGFQWAPLMASSLAAQIAGQPQPILRAQREAVHPGRLLIREMSSRQRDTV